MSRRARRTLVGALLLTAAVVLEPTRAAHAGPTLGYWTWAAWENLGGNVNVGPTCVSRGANLLDCVTSGPWTYPLSHQSWNGTAWAPWETLPGLSITANYRSSPSCVATSADRFDCFAVGVADGALYHRWWQANAPSWWENLGGVLTSDASCVARTGGHIDCFARGTDGALHGRGFDGNIWQGWFSLGGTVAEESRPSCAAVGNAIECVATFTDNNLHNVSFDGTSWGGWTAMPGLGVALPFSNTAPASPKCIATTTGTVMCVAPFIATTGYPSLHRFEKTPGAQSWGISDLGDDFGQSTSSSLGGINSYDVECVARAPDRVDCMELVGRQNTSGFGAIGPDTVTFRQFYWTSTTASAWFDNNLNIVANGSFVTYGLSCTSWGSDRIDCFAAPGWLNSGPLLHTYYYFQRILLPPR